MSEITLPFHLNQDMKKFTSVMDCDEFRAFLCPLLSQMGQCGIFIDNFVWRIFNKYCELKDDLFLKYRPDLKTMTDKIKK